MNLDGVLLWSLAATCGAGAWWTRRRGVGPKGPVILGFVMTAFVAWFPGILFLTDTLAAVGRISQTAAFLLTVGLALGVGGIATFSVARFPNRWLIYGAPALGFPVVYLALAPGGPVQTGVTFVAAVLAMMGAALLPAAFRGVAETPPSQRRVLWPGAALVGLLLFFSAVGFAFALGYPLTEIRRDVEIGVVGPPGVTFSVTLVLDQVAPEITSAHVESGSAIATVSNHELTITGSGNVTVSARAAFFDPEPVPASNGREWILFAHASEDVDAHIKVFAGRGAHWGCYLLLDRTVRLEKGATETYDVPKVCAD